MIDQANFAYSPSGKAFEKETKTIEDQGKKQIKAIEENKNLYNKQIGNNVLILSKEREKYRNIYNKRLDKINEWSKVNDCDGLKFIISSGCTKTDFSELKGPVAFLDSMKKWEEFNRYPKKVRIGNKSKK